MTTLPAYLVNPSRQYRLEQARSKFGGSPDSIAAEVEQQIVRIYGSRAAYDACRATLGMSDEHAARFERYGVVLQPKQIEFAVWARRADNADGPNEIGLGGARGPGKSFAILAVAGLDFCLTHCDLKVLYLRKTATAAKEQLEDLARKVFRWVPGIHITAGRIEFDNDSRILIGGFKDDNAAQGYQGVENDILIIEEATQLSGKTHDALRLSNRSSKDFGGIAWRPRRFYSFNPLGIGHAYIKKRFVDNERAREKGKPFEPKHRFIFGTIDDNVFVDPDYVDSLDELSGVEYQAYRLGNWDVSAGAYFETFRVGVHVIPPLTDVSYMTEIWASMDFGFAHWNVCYLHAQDGDGNTYTVDELAHRKRHPDEIAPDIKVWLAQYDLDREKLSCFLVGSDAFSQHGSARTTVAQQYAEAGIYMSRWDATPGSRVAGALLMGRLLGDPERGIAPRWYISSKCEKLIECLPYLERDIHNAEDVRKVNADDRGRGGDDPYDAVRGGIYRPHVTRITTS